jgi:hypothetical protein
LTFRAQRRRAGEMNALAAALDTSLPPVLFREYNASDTTDEFIRFPTRI